MTRYAQPNEKVSLFSLPKNFPARMKTQPKYKWYKPLLALILCGVLYLVFCIVVGAAQILYNTMVLGVSLESMAADNYLGVSLTDPIGLLFMVALVAVMIPATLIGVKATGLGGLGGLASESGRMRWDRYKKLLAPLFVVSLVVIFGDYVIELALNDSLGELANITVSPLALIVIIVFVPLQCAAEEYVFRGLTLQAFGAWIPLVIFPLILQAFVFALGHGYNLAGNISIFVNGLAWGWITLKTGGIEASVSLHVSNNVAGILLGSLYASAAVQSTVSVESAIFDIIFAIIMVAITYFLCKRNGYLIADVQDEPEVEDADCE